MIRSILATSLLTWSVGAAQAQYLATGSNPNNHGVSGYTRSNGTYVQPYTATNSNSTLRDNYGASGNYNPSTGTFSHRSARY